MNQSVKSLGLIAARRTDAEDDAVNIDSPGHTHDTPWHQVNITYPGKTRQQREQRAVAHLHQVLPAAEWERRGWREKA